MLGTRPDAEVARRLGVRRGAVLAKRRELRIPSWRGSRAWTKSELRRLGTMSDSDLAKKLGLSKSKVVAQRVTQGIPSLGGRRYHRWTKAEKAKLGTVPDDVLARELGVTKAAVKSRKFSDTEQRKSSLAGVGPPERGESRR